MVGGIGWNSLLTDEVLFLLERFFLGNTNHRLESKTRVLWTLVIFHAVNIFCTNYCYLYHERNYESGNCHRKCNRFDIEVTSIKLFFELMSTQPMTRHRFLSY